MLRGVKGVMIFSKNSCLIWVCSIWNSNGRLLLGVGVLFFRGWTGSSVIGSI